MFLSSIFLSVSSDNLERYDLAGHIDPVNRPQAGMLQESPRVVLKPPKTVAGDGGNLERGHPLAGASGFRDCQPRTLCEAQLARGSDVACLGVIALNTIGRRRREIASAFLLVCCDSRTGPTCRGQHAIDPATTDPRSGRTSSPAVAAAAPTARPVRAARPASRGCLRGSSRPGNPARAAEKTRPPS